MPDLEKSIWDWIDGEGGYLVAEGSLLLQRAYRAGYARGVAVEQLAEADRGLAGLSAVSIYVCPKCSGCYAAPLDTKQVCGVCRVSMAADEHFMYVGAPAA